MKKMIVVGVILLLVCMSIPSTGRVMDKSNPLSVEGNTLYVGGSGPGNYTKIQDAIDNASDGDTVFVYNGTYVENVYVGKSISLIGEDKVTTIIDGNWGDDVVEVTDDWVNISGFIIQNSGDGVHDAGIDIRSNHNIIFNNNIKNNEVGILIIESSENIISENDILYNEHKGMYIHSKSSNNIIRENNILNNDYSLDISGGDCIGNKIYHNNIINNGRIKAFDDGNNTWDNGHPSGGNYWDYYNGKDKNGDGIGDEPYLIINPDIPGFQVGTDDRYPLMTPYNLTEPYLAIKINIIGFGVKISIKNVGNETAYDVNWNITTVGAFHRFTNIHKEGHSSLPLKTGEEKKFRLIPLGFWEPIDIEIIANATNTVESKKIASGMILLCFVIVTDFY